MTVTVLPTARAPVAEAANVKTRVDGTLPDVDVLGAADVHVTADPDASAMVNPSWSLATSASAEVLMENVVCVPATALVDTKLEDRLSDPVALSGRSQAEPAVLARATTSCAPEVDTVPVPAQFANAPPSATETEFASDPNTAVLLVKVTDPPLASAPAEDAVNANTNNAGVPPAFGGVDTA